VADKAALMDVTALLAPRLGVRGRSRSGDV
jgi:hypothetical protein